MNCTHQPACEAGDILVAPGVSPGFRILCVSKPAKRAAEIPDFALTFENLINDAEFCRPFGAHHHFYAPCPRSIHRPLRGLVVAVLLTIFFSMSAKVPAQISVSPTPTANAT